jgi:hypothetical protein
MNVKEKVLLCSVPLWIDFTGKWWGSHPPGALRGTAG